MLDRPGLMLGTYDYVADTRYSLGRRGLPVLRRRPHASASRSAPSGSRTSRSTPRTSPTAPAATYSVNETFVGATFAQNFSDRFSAGITAKYVDDRLGTVSGSAFAVDFGTNFHASLNNHPVKFSFVLANLGSNLTYSGTGLARRRAARPAAG